MEMLSQTFSSIGKQMAVFSRKSPELCALWSDSIAWSSRLFDLKASRFCSVKFPESPMFLKYIKTDK